MEHLQIHKHKNQKVIHSRMLARDELEQGKTYFMSSSYPTHFTKFRAVPKVHATAARVLKYMETQQLSLKEALNRLKIISIDKTEKNFINCAKIHRNEINYLLEKVTLLKDCPFLDIYVIKVFLAQLLWGNQSLPLGTIESTNLLYYEPDFKEAFPEADTVLFKTYVSKLPTYVRVNTLSISLEQCINAFCKEGWILITYPKSYSDYLVVVSQLKGKEFVRDIHISELLVFPSGTSFYNHPGYLKGKFVLQDKGSCLASFLLNPKPGSVVLDMCAAPGRTTNHLANIINNEGIVYAVENHPHRYNRLYSFLELTNVRCAETIWSDNKQIEIDNVNYVLIDGPSTYTGIFYKRPRNGLGRRLKQYFHNSFKTLIYALHKFKTAKRIVYSSCTNYPEEGEKVVQYALAKLNDSYTLLDVKELLWNEWLNTGQMVNNCGNFPLANKCLRINPDIDRCYGYFIAVFERNFEVPIPPIFQKGKLIKGSSKFDEDETDDETPNDNNHEIPKPMITPLIKKSTVPPFVKKQIAPPSAKNQTAPPFVKRSQRKIFFDKLKKQTTKSKQQFRSHPYLPNSQTCTSTNQTQTSYPGSQPFYEVRHSQLYP